jgi:hypothetical protein
MGTIKFDIRVDFDKFFININKGRVTVMIPDDPDPDSDFYTFFRTVGRDLRKFLKIVKDLPITEGTADLVYFVVNRYLHDRKIVDRNVEVSYDEHRRGYNVP